MSFTINNKSRDKRKIKSITNSQRSSCAVVLYRYENPDIIKTEAANITNEKLFKGGVASAQGNLESRKRMVIDNDVVRVNIEKNKGSSSGSFSVVLKRGKRENGEELPSGPDVNYLKAINPGDWIMLYIKKSGKINTDSIKPDSGLRMIGIVENIRYIEKDQGDSAFPELTYVIQGRDFGKVFDMDIFFNPALNSDSIKQVLGVSFLEDISKSVKLKGKNPADGFSPDEVLKTAVDFYLGGTLDSQNRTNQNWYIPKLLASKFFPSDRKIEGASFIDILDQEKLGIQKYSNGNLSLNPLQGRQPITSLSSEGTVWSVLNFLSNPVLNELYTELTDVNGILKPSIICRQMPFSIKPRTAATESNCVLDRMAQYRGVSKLNSPVPEFNHTYFTELPRININSVKIIEKNVGKSDFERVNHVVVTPRDVTAQSMSELYASIVNIPSIQRYGLKSIRSQTSYAFEKDFTKFCETCADLIVEWFFLSHLYYNGTIVIDGIDTHVEIGKNLYIEDIGQLYHIEGYSHTYEQEAGGRISFNTAFRVSRGQILLDNNTTRFIDEDANKRSISISSSVLENVRNR